MFKKGEARKAGCKPSAVRRWGSPMQRWCNHKIGGRDGLHQAGLDSLGVWRAFYQLRGKVDERWPKELTPLHWRLSVPKPTTVRGAECQQPTTRTGKRDWPSMDQASDDSEGGDTSKQSKSEHGLQHKQPNIVPAEGVVNIVDQPSALNFDPIARFAQPKIVLIMSKSGDCRYKSVGGRLLPSVEKAIGAYMSVSEEGWVASVSKLGRKFHDASIRRFVASVGTDINFRRSSPQVQEKVTSSLMDMVVRCINSTYVIRTSQRCIDCIIAGFLYLCSLYTFHMRKLRQCKLIKNGNHTFI